jgi:hypothetical protein
VDVAASSRGAAIVAFGSSLTDGDGTFIGGINNATGGLNNVHALAGATGNVFIGGQFNNVNPGGYRRNDFCVRR